MTVPVVSAPSLVADDVPIEEAESIPDAPAQPPVEGTVTTAAPGGGVATVDGVTSQYLEFDVSAEHDNASMEGVVTPAQPADIDLYLERQLADGSWEEVPGPSRTAASSTGRRSRPGGSSPATIGSRCTTTSARPATRWRSS